MAVKLKVLHVQRDILRGLTAKEFRGWEHYHELEPLTEERQDLRIASILQMLYTINKGKNGKNLPLKDFLLKWEREEKTPQAPQKQFELLRLLAAMHANDGPPKPDLTPGTIDGEKASAVLAKARQAMIG